MGDGSRGVALGGEQGAGVYRRAPHSSSRRRR